MDRKSQACYEAVLEFIISKIYDIRSTVKLFITDYEIAMRNAIRKKCINGVFTACLFHHTQALRRRALKIDGFFEFLRDNKPARFVYHKIMYLALLPAYEIATTFDYLKTEAEKIDRIEFEEFLNYYHKQWIRNEGPSQFSVFGKEIRTTSAAEGFNRALNEYCHKHGSFIWFVVSIRNQEHMKSNELVQFIESGGLCGSRQAKVYKVSIKF